MEGTLVILIKVANIYLARYIKEFHQLVKYHVQDYVVYHAIMNALNLVRQHAGIDVEMHVLLPAVIHVRDVPVNAWIHVKLNAKIRKVLHVLNPVQVRSKLFQQVVLVEFLQKTHYLQPHIHVVVAVTRANFILTRKQRVGMQVAWDNVSHHVNIHAQIVVMADALITVARTRVNIKLVKVEVVLLDVQSIALVYVKIHVLENVCKHVIMDANKNVLTTAHMNVLLAAELIAQIIAVMHVLAVQVNAVAPAELKQMLIHVVVVVHTEDVCQPV